MEDQKLSLCNPLKKSQSEEKNPNKTKRKPMDTVSKRGRTWKCTEVVMDLKGVERKETH